MKYSKILKFSLIISYILSGVIIVVCKANNFFDNSILEKFFELNVSEGTEIILFFLLLGFIFFFSLNMFLLPLYLVKACFVTAKAINEQYIDTKETIYTRELPNYNSSIAGELLDFKTNFQNEYIAGVIELISKGYIIENENNVIVNKNKTTEKLLKNEKYILETCENIELITSVKITNEFNKKIKEDMKALGLYKTNIFIDRIIQYLKKYSKYIFLALYLCSPLLLIGFIENQFAVISIIAIIFLLANIIRRMNKLTKKGELEKEKIGKLKLFLEKQTNFKNKTDAEREIWGRYSAFAIALDLNQEMKEEIKKKIIKQIQ